MQWHVKDLGHSAKNAGGRLHLDTHTPLTHWRQSGLTCCCPGIVWEPIWKWAHMKLVKEHLATVVPAHWATVDWSWQGMNSWKFYQNPCKREKRHHHHSQWFKPSLACFGWIWKMCVCVCVCVCEGGGRGMLVRHLCVLHVFLMTRRIVFACFRNVCCIVGLVYGHLPLFQTSLCAHIPRYTHVYFFLFGCLLYTPWVQLRRGSLRPHYIIMMMITIIIKLDSSLFWNAGLPPCTNHQ